MPDPTVVVDGVPVVPEPLRATDGGFTEDSVRRRLPCIVESILEHNNTYSAELVHALRQLAAEIMTVHFTWEGREVCRHGIPKLWTWVLGCIDADFDVQRSLQIARLHLQNASNFADTKSSKLPAYLMTNLGECRLTNDSSLRFVFFEQNSSGNRGGKRAPRSAGRDLVTRRIKGSFWTVVAKGSRGRRQKTLNVCTPADAAASAPPP